MTSTIRKNPQFDERSYTVEYWRERFETLYEQIGRKTLIYCLIEVDEKFDRVQWLRDSDNVRRGKANLIKTKKVVDALEIYVSRRKSVKAVA